MIKKVTTITQYEKADDKVTLTWYDMQKPNLTAVSEKGIEFIVKAKYTHLHEHDLLVCEDGYKIEVLKSFDELYVLEFSDHITFAKMAYEIGNRHQPICVEDYKITVLDDISLHDIIDTCKELENVQVSKIEAIFRPNGKAHHSH